MQVAFHRDHQSRSRRWDTRRRICGLTLITDDIAEMLKNATQFCLYGLLWGLYRLVSYIFGKFSSSWC